MLFPGKHISPKSAHSDKHFNNIKWGHPIAGVRSIIVGSGTVRGRSAVSHTFIPIVGHTFIFFNERINVIFVCVYVDLEENPLYTHLSISEQRNDHCGQV